MQVPLPGTTVPYDPNHPQNIADRANDPDDGIDYEEIIMSTQADFEAGRGIRYASIEEFSAWLDEIWQQVVERRLAEERAAS